MKESIIVSLYEGGYQPLNAMTGLAALRDRGYEVAFLDAYVDGFDIDQLKSYETIVLPIPLFDSLNAAVELCRELREGGCSSRIVMYGQYATINARHLADSYADHVISGEWEVPLVSLFDFLDGKGAQVVNVVSRDRTIPGKDVPLAMMRGRIARPRRDLAPPLSKYPQPHLARLLGEEKIVGGLELTRGCHHKCTYCSVYSAYDGKITLGDEKNILDDVDTLVGQGMEHLTFIDAEFFNATRRSFEILNLIHRRHPSLTYDFTTRVDHILDNRDRLHELYDAGVRVITSALEFPKDEVLRQVCKEVGVDDLKKAASLVHDAGIVLNPTFIMYNPWVSLEDFDLMEEFLQETRLKDVMDPIQYMTRLHLYKGSPLLNNETIRSLHMTEHEFFYDWEHPDARVDEHFKIAAAKEQEGTFKRCCLKC